MSEKFKLVSSFKTEGDQPKAIDQLVEQINEGLNHLTLLSATGTRKTFTISNVIELVNRPTLVMAHNITFSAQLYSSIIDFSPLIAVEYYFSYYFYYQPTTHVPATDTC